MVGNKLRVLWHINNMVPLGENKVNFVNEGWISGLALELVKKREVELIVCYGQSICKEVIEEKIGSIRTIGYYNCNRELYQENLISKIAGILFREKPDIVHIMGTEYPHSLSVYYACENLGISDRVIVSIQGIISECAKLYDYRLPDRLLKKKTVRDWQFKRTSIFEEKQKFEYQGKYEKELFCKKVVFLGRTSWDQQCLKEQNVDVDYRHCDEVLRRSFYESVWNIENCRRRSIFISQATYPLKGFHLFLEVLPVIVKRYPDVMVYVAGNNPLVYHTKRINMGTYERYCYTLLKRAKGTKNVIFLGALKEEDMVKQYLAANLFISPSILENSCNSVGEAMLLGVPTISSLVGGISSLIEDGVDGFYYPLDRRDLFVERVSQIFDNDELAISLSEKAKLKAASLHNPDMIVDDLINIYMDVVKK